MRRLSAAARSLADPDAFLASVLESAKSSACGCRHCSRRPIALSIMRTAHSSAKLARSVLRSLPRIARAGRPAPCARTRVKPLLQSHLADPLRPGHHKHTRKVAEATAPCILVQLFYNALCRQEWQDACAAIGRDRMARPREFDEGTVLGAAVLCFWRQGYEATSVRDLVEQTGITAASLYNPLETSARSIRRR